MVRQKSFYRCISMKKTQAILFAIAYGWIEQYLFLKFPGAVGERIFFNQFSFYHLVLLAIFAITAWNNPRFIPLIALIQDIFFHIFRWTLPNQDSWVTWIFGGYILEPIFLPGTYILLGLIYYYLDKKT